ncbi:hypothetical protein [Niabella aquatica]
MKSFIFKTFLLVCLATGLPGLFFACTKNSNDPDGDIIGGHTHYIYFKIKSLEAKNGDKSISAGSREADGSVKKEDYVILVRGVPEQVDKPQPSAFVPFINTAYAENLKFVNVDTIVSLKIITLKDFGKDLPAGSDVTNKFGTNNPEVSLQDWKVLRYLSSDRGTTGATGLGLPFFLTGLPENGIKAAQFKVVYTLQSGGQLEATTREVDLL